MQKLLSLPDPDRADLLEFLGVTPKPKVEMEKLFQSLTDSIALRQLSTNKRPN